MTTRQEHLYKFGLEFSYKEDPWHRESGQRLFLQERATRAISQAIYDKVVKAARVYHDTSRMATDYRWEFYILTPMELDHLIRSEIYSAMTAVNYR